MMECIKMLETKQLLLIKLLYIVCVLKSAISLEDQQSALAPINEATCPHCYQQLESDIPTLQNGSSYTFNHQMPTTDLINGTQLTAANLSAGSIAPPEVGLNDTNSRSIYVSLMKILQQLKNQMKGNSSEVESGDPYALVEAETVAEPVAVGGFNQLRRSEHDWSLKKGASKEKRYNRDTGKQAKRQSRYDSLPPSISFISGSDLQDSKNQAQPTISFDDSSTSMKKTSYSKYLGPTIDVMTTKLRSNRKLNQHQTESADNNWYPNDEYTSTSSRPPYDELPMGPLKQEMQTDPPLPVYTTPGPEYMHSSTSGLPSTNEHHALHYPSSKTSSAYSFPVPEVKPSLDQAIRETAADHPEPTILLVRRQRNQPALKRSRGATAHHKSSASHRESVHLAHAGPLDSSFPSEHEDSEASQSVKSSSNFGELGDELFRPKSAQPIYLQQLDSRPPSSHQSTGTHNQYLSQYLQLQPQASQKVYYTLTTLPQAAAAAAAAAGGLKAMPASASHLKSVLGSPAQRDLLNQPQTIQITSIPAGSGLNNAGGALVRVNGANLGGLFNSGLDLPGLPGLPGFPGRPVLMVNSERRLDWSWIIWPVAVVVALPLILSALFVPVFLKSIIIFIQILQSLGLVMPPSGLAHHLSSGGSNLTAFN